MAIVRQTTQLAKQTFRVSLPGAKRRQCELFRGQDFHNGPPQQRSVRRQLISEVTQDARRYIVLIKTLMAVLPLLGLLGTVTGMIQVFDVMAFTGTGNARLMAGGVSAATIPTMSGLVAALSGLYLATHLEQSADTKVKRAEDLLVH